jgi:predicted TIM-barrel fold metal-dependent hydrolase
VPDLMYRLKSAASRSPGYFSVDPVESFCEHVWVTPFWEDNVEAIAQTLPLDRLLLGSDWPHAEGVVQPIDFVTEALSWADDRTREQIDRLNAVDLLGVNAP